MKDEKQEDRRGQLGGRGGGEVEGLGCMYYASQMHINSQVEEKVEQPGDPNKEQRVTEMLRKLSTYQLGSCIERQLLVVFFP